MPITYDGNLIATGMRFGIVVSRWNSIITERMLEGALDGLYRHGADPDSIEVARVAAEVQPHIDSRLGRICSRSRGERV